MRSCEIIQAIICKIAYLFDYFFLRNNNGFGHEPNQKLLTIQTQLPQINGGKMRKTGAILFTGVLLMAACTTKTADENPFFQNGQHRMVYRLLP